MENTKIILSKQIKVPHFPNSNAQKKIKVTLNNFLTFNVQPKIAIPNKINANTRYHIPKNQCKKEHLYKISSAFKNPFIQIITTQKLIIIVLILMINKKEFLPFLVAIMKKLI